MDGERDLVSFVPCDPGVLQGVADVVALFVLLLAQLLQQALGERVRQCGKFVVFEPQLEFLRPHARVVKRVPALIKDHVENDRAGPQIHRLRVTRLAEDLRRHVEQGPALGFDVGGAVYLQLGGESEVNDFDGGEIVTIREQYVLYLIMQILAWL